MALHIVREVERSAQSVHSEVRELFGKFLSGFSCIACVPRYVVNG